MILVNFENKEFLYKKINNINILISLVGLEINPKYSNYKETLNFIKKSFNLSQIYTVSQTHSNIVRVCHEKFKSGIEGDGLITNKKLTAIGVFTADCIPIFLFDIKNQIISVVHSGWQGTYKEIVSEAINIFINKYNSSIEDLIVYIGPHNMSCCYEVGEDLKEKFSNHPTFKGNFNIFNGNNLNMSECVKLSLKTKGVLEKNIHFIDYCTYCSSDFKFYSYRRDNKSLNRIFSFAFMD